MTLDECYNHYKGVSVLVDGNPADQGQCVQWADVVLAEVYGDVTHYGNAIDWWNDPGELLNEGFVKIADGSVKKGDFVVFNQRVGSVYGHIDVAMQDGTTNDYIGADSNWNKNLTVHEVHHTGSQYVLGALRLKSNSEEVEMPNDGDITNVKRFQTQDPTFQPEGKDFDFYKDPSHGWPRLTYDMMQALQPKIDQFKNQASADFEPVNEQLFKKKG